MTLGYMSQPKAAGMRPGVVLMHDGAACARAFAGWRVISPRPATRLWHPISFRRAAARPAFEESRWRYRKAVEATTAADVAAQASARLPTPSRTADSGGRDLGLLGIGWGGTHVLLFAPGRPDAAACVVFYPDPQQALSALPKIAAPVLAIFAGDDPATSDSVQKFEQAALSGKQKHVVKVFSGVMRGFHDPGKARIYKPDAAKEAWTLAIDHLDAAHKRQAVRRQMSDEVEE